MSALLGGLADQEVVGSWGDAGTDAEERIERGMSYAAPIEAEDELVEVVLEVRLAQSVVTPRPQRLRFENRRWAQGSTMCAAIGPTVIALCLISGMSLYVNQHRTGTLRKFTLSG